jgi:hypothetical protein
MTFEKVSDVPLGNESRLSFSPKGNMIVFFRNGSLATSPPPYKKWTVNETNKKGPHSYLGFRKDSVGSGSENCPFFQCFDHLL